MPAHGRCLAHTHACRLPADAAQPGRKRIARLMRQASLVGAGPRQDGPTTTRRDQAARPAPDLLDLNVTADAPNPLWARLAKVPAAKPLE